MLEHQQLRRARWTRVHPFRKHKSARTHRNSCISILPGARFVPLAFYKLRKLLLFSQTHTQHTQHTQRTDQQRTVAHPYAQQLHHPHAAALHASASMCATTQTSTAAHSSTPLRTAAALHTAALHASALMLFSRHKSLLPRLHAIATSAQLTLNCRQQRPTTRRRHLPYCTLANAAQSTSERPTRARQWHHRLLVQRNCQMAQSRHTISLIDCCQSAGTCASQPHVLQDGGIVGLRYDQGHRANRSSITNVHCARQVAKCCSAA